jgi:hypothetical protein
VGAEGGDRALAKGTMIVPFNTAGLNVRFIPKSRHQSQRQRCPLLCQKTVIKPNLTAVDANVNGVRRLPISCGVSAPVGNEVGTSISSEPSPAAAKKSGSKI